MSVTGARVPKRGNAFGRWLHGFAGYKKYGALTLMFIPVVLYFCIFKYIPMGGIVIAFKNFKISQGIFGSAWCGLDNFNKAFRTPTFARSVTNTLTISGLKLLFCFPAPIILALMLNEVTHLRFNDSMRLVLQLDFIQQDARLHKQMRRLYLVTRPFGVTGDLTVRYREVPRGLAIEYRITDLRIWGRRASDRLIREILKANGAR